MTHLDAEELIAAIDGDLSSSRQAHLAGCEACRTALVDTRQALEATLLDVEVPEPSPLFWDHLSARIREATRDEVAPRRETWWVAAWKPLLAGGVAATLLWVVGVRPGVDHRGPVASDATTESAPAPATTWDDVVAEADTLSADDVSSVASVGADTSALVDELTPAEREAFVQLLEREMGQVP